MMFNFIVLLLTLLQIVKSDPSCITPTGQAVDWFITLKLNNGDEYAYCDALNCTKIQATGKYINDLLDSPVLRTLKQVEDGPNLPADQGYLLWNDQPPNGITATTTNAHAKGFIGLGKTSGFLLVHSVPEFPAFTDANLNKILLHIDDSQQIFGQHFICTTTTVINLEKIACGYNIDNPKVFGSKLPSTMTATTHPCLTQMVNNKRNTKTMSLIIPYMTLGGVNFTKFSKSKDNNIPLYEQVVCPELKAGLLVQSWGRPYEDPTCTGPYKVVSNSRVQIEGAPMFKDSQDHSKYGISIDNTLPYVCLGDINRMKSQWTRGGGTICFKDANIHKQFSKFLTCSGCINNNGYGDINNTCDPSCQNCAALQCDATCGSCSAPQDPNACTSCQYGFYLSGTQCLPCKSPCADCFKTDSMCTECVDNYTLQNYVQCLPTCDPSCLTCSSPLSADTCSSCPPGSYLSGSKCQPCLSPCSSCTKGDVNSCTSCVNNYTLVGSQCKPICDSTCLTCSSPNNSKSCLTCSADKYLNVATNECLSCNSVCASCKDSANNCTSCQANYKLNGNKCDIICDSSCLTCSKPVDSSSCITCSPGYYLAAGSKCTRCQAPCATCVDDAAKCTSCIDYFTLNNNDCQHNSGSPSSTCHSSCKTCTKDADPKACSSCPSTFYLSAANECFPCTSPCYNCSGSPITCSSCISNFQLSGSTCTPQCDSSCSSCSKPVDAQSCTNCNQGYYLSAGKCLRCKGPCQNCIDQESKCTSCIDGYNLSGNTCQVNIALNTCHSSCKTCSKFNDSKSCSTCQNGSFLNSTNECIPCSSPCSTCNGTATTCTDCQANYILSGNSCNPVCDSSCSKCSKPVDPLGCTVCRGGTYLFQQQCLSCKAPCLNCVDTESKCTLCIDNYTFKSNSCSINTCHSSCLTCSISNISTACTSCIQSQYLTKTNECKACKAPCFECKGSEDTCSSCQPGYVLEGAQCVIKKPIDATTTKKSIKCHPFCGTCTGTKYYQCLTCSQNRILKTSNSGKTNECVCPSGTTDKQQPKCETNTLQENLESAHSGLFTSSSITSVLTSIASFNPLTIMSYLDFAQTVSSFTYVNKKYAYHYDSQLKNMYYSNLNIPIKGISSKQSSSRMLESIDIGNANENEETNNSHANPKMFMNDRYPQFITNALTLIIIISIIWVISMLSSKIAVMNSDSFKAKIKSFFYQACPLVLFIFTVQELSVLVFFQFQQMQFSTTLDAFSSISSILSLIYIISICGYMYSSIERLHYQYFRFNTSPDASPTLRNRSKILPMVSTAQQLDTHQMNTKFEGSQIKNEELTDLAERFQFFREFLKQDSVFSRHFGLIIICRKIITALVQSFCYGDPIAQAIILCVSFGLYFFLSIKIRPFQNIRYQIFSGVVETILFIMHICLIIIVASDDGSDTQLLFTLVQMANTIVLTCLYLILGVFILLRFAINYFKKSNKSDEFIFKQALPSKSQLDDLDQSQNSPSKKKINTLTNIHPNYFGNENNGNRNDVHIQNIDPHNHGDQTVKPMQPNINQDGNSFTIVSNMPSQIIKVGNNKIKRNDSRGKSGKIIEEDNDGYIHQIEYNDHQLNQMISNINKKS